MKKNFQSPSRKFIKFMIEQFRSLMSYNCYSASRTHRKWYDPHKYQASENKEGWTFMKDSARRLNQFCYLWNQPREDNSKALHWSSSEDSEEGPIIVNPKQPGLKKSKSETPDLLQRSMGSYMLSRAARKNRRSRKK